MTFVRVPYHPSLRKTQSGLIVVIGGGEFPVRFVEFEKL
jgi:hypothetical protein